MRGLEASGHECVGVEIDPIACALSEALIDGDVMNVSVNDPSVDALIEGSDAVWASPPCQMHSTAGDNNTNVESRLYVGDWLPWSLGIMDRFPNIQTLWVENVVGNDASWGTLYNAAQFDGTRQNRNRVIGGTYPPPRTKRPYARWYQNLDICPAIMATEYKGCAGDRARASRYYGRRLTLDEAAFHMGLDGLPMDWQVKPKWFDGPWGEWERVQYRALGNGVPVWMSKAFGDALSLDAMVRGRCCG